MRDDLWHEWNLEHVDYALFERCRGKQILCGPALNREYLTYVNAYFQLVCILIGTRSLCFEPFTPQARPRGQGLLDSLAAGVAAHTAREAGRARYEAGTQRDGRSGS